MPTNNKFNNSPIYRKKMEESWAIWSYKDAAQKCMFNAMNSKPETEMLSDWLKEKLKNLKKYLPWQEDIVYEFADYLSTRVRAELVPMWFNLFAELAIYDLQNGNVINHRVASYPDILFWKMRSYLPKVAKAMFSEEYWNAVEKVQNSVKDMIKKKNIRN